MKAKELVEERALVSRSSASAKNVGREEMEDEAGDSSQITRGSGSHNEGLDILQRSPNL